jgi:hypothetical protein
MYPQGNGPDNWSPYDQQPYQHDPYAPQQPYPNDPYAQQPYQHDPYAQQQSSPPYANPYQQGQPGPQYPGPQYPGPQLPGPGAPRPASSKTPLMIVGAVIGGFLLFCVAGIAVVALTSSDEDTDPAAVGSAPATATTGAPATPSATPTKAPTPTSTGSPSSYDLEGDLDGFKQGDCLTITGANREVKPAKCSDAGAMKVFLRRDGVDASRDDVCDAVEETTDILFIDDVGIANDLVLCVGEA